MTAGHEMLLALLHDLAEEGQVGGDGLLRHARLGRRPLPGLDHRPLLLQEAAHEVEVFGHDLGARIGRYRRIGVDVQRGLGLPGDDTACLGRGDRRRGGPGPHQLLQGLAIERRVAKHRHGVVEQHTVRPRIDRLGHVDSGDAPPVEQRLQAHRPAARVKLGQDRQQLLDAVATAQIACDRDLPLAGGNVVDERGEVARRSHLDEATDTVGDHLLDRFPKAHLLRPLCGGELANAGRRAREQPGRRAGVERHPRRPELDAGVVGEEGRAHVRKIGRVIAAVERQRQADRAGAGQYGLQRSDRLGRAVQHELVGAVVHGDHDL